MKHPRIVIAATRSGSGKTLLTCALLDAIRKHGKSVSAFKCGPDYIDPMFHQKVIGVPSKNLDLFFTDEETTRTLFLQDNQSDVSVIEGVMGLYDGIGGIHEEASTYHLAKALKAPIILVINGHGMGRSMIAEINGFLAMDKEHLIKGVILNQVSPMFYETIRPVIEEETGVTVLGYYEKQKDIQLESRHLGLKLPHEIEELQHMVNKASDAFLQSVSVDRLLNIAYQAEELDNEKQLEIPYVGSCRIGVARDEAFCFYYEDNLRILEKMGAELVPFSPLHDYNLPENLDGLLIGGGYPELRGRELQDNSLIRSSIRSWITYGMPVLAECGGFMYLHEYLEDESGRCYEMVGTIPGTTYWEGKLVRFGYVELQHEDMHIRGHEFHYYDSENNGADMVATKPYSKRSWETSHVSDNRCVGFPHLYYASNMEFPKNFIERCIEFQKIKEE